MYLVPRSAQKFWWFTLANVLVDNCGAALGVFVSCLFNDINMALTIMPLFLLPLMVFSGFFVNSDSIPPYFWWIQWISPMKYGFTALAINEFSGLAIYCTPEQNCAPGFNGDTVLANLGFNSKGSLQMVRRCGSQRCCGCPILTDRTLANLWNVLPNYSKRHPHALVPAHTEPGRPVCNHVGLHHPRLRGAVERGSQYQQVARKKREHPWYMVI